MRSLRSGAHDSDAFGLEHLIEQSGESVPVSDQEPEVAGSLSQIEHRVAGLLGDPSGGRVRRDTEHMDTAGGALDHGEHVQPGERNRLYMEEVGGQNPFRLVLRNWAQVGSLRRGAGPNPAYFGIAHTVAEETFRLRPAISPAIADRPRPDSQRPTAAPRLGWWA
ncbi:hypothetical protein ACRYCC_40465 [Actinomadura scrupuli]|uniref:hypothetical protein n=1 Tax=Actinomadura scrupuli TaxID=559629 RepID=UPI003D994A98